MKKSSIANQLEVLLEYGTVQIGPGMSKTFEVTVFTTDRQHRHYGGDTLAEAFNRAFMGTIK